MTAQRLGLIQEFDPLRTITLVNFFNTHLSWHSIKPKVSWKVVELTIMPALWLPQEDPIILHPQQ